MHRRVHKEIDALFPSNQTVRLMQAAPPELMLTVAEQSASQDPLSLFKLRRLNTRIATLIKNNPYLWTLATDAIMRNDYLSFLEITKDEMLLFAVCQENIPLLKSLIYAGHDVNKVFDKETRDNLVSEPSLGPNSDAAFGGHSLLHDACLFGCFAVVQVLVSNGANIHALTENGVTPLHSAAKSGSMEICEFLIRQGASVSAKTTNLGQTPMHYLATNRTVTASSICLLLDQNGGSTKEVDIHGCTPMILSVTNGNMNLFTTLLRLDPAQIDSTDKDGRTALHHAILNDQPEICSILIHHGADVDLKDNFGMSARLEAVPDNFVDEAIIKLVSKSRKAVSYSVYWAICVAIISMKIGK